MSALNNKALATALKLATQAMELLNGLQAEVDAVKPLKDGMDGLPGQDGLPGTDGAIGRDGAEGPQGPLGETPEHKWQGEKLSFKNPDGTWGKAIDLRGPQGSGGGSGGGGGGVFSDTGIITLWSGTQASYNALTHRSDTLYFIQN